MAGFFGNSVANSAHQTRKSVGASAWTALSVGDTPKSGRFAVRVFIKGKTGFGLGLTYVNRNADETFTAPTTNLKDCTYIPGGRIWVEPLSDKVALYGKLKLKNGETNNSVPVIITEFC